MAERLAYLEAVIGADITQFRKGMRDVRSEIGLLDEAMKGLSAVGRTMTYTLTAPIVTLGTYAVQAASEFDSAMRNINAIAQLSEDELRDLSEAVLDFGRTTRSGPVEAAQAMYTAFSAGITNTATALEFMEVSSLTAEAGLADLTRTTEALVASFLAFGGGDLPVVEQLELINLHSDALTQMVQIGVGSMNTFATAIGRVIPTAVSLDTSIEDLYGSVAFLTQRGLGAETAATSLNSALVALLKPSDAMEEAFQQLGVTTGKELIEKFGGLDEALMQLVETAGYSEQKIAEIFQNRQALRAIFLMMENVDAYKKAIEDFNAGVDGATARAHEQQMQSFAAHWDLMTSALKGAAITIGNVLLPVLIPLVEGIAGMLNGISEANSEILALGVAFAALAAATGPVLWLIGSMVNPIAAVIVSVGALATAFVTNIGGIRDTVMQGVHDIFGDISGLSTAIDGIAAALFPSDAGEQILAAAPRVAIPPERLVSVTVASGQTLWDIWFKDYKTQFTWEAFKEAVGWGDPNRLGHVLEVGEIITLPGSFRDDFMGMFDVGVSVRDVINRILSGGGIGSKIATADLPGISLDEVLGKTPIDQAVDLFNELIRPTLEGMVNSAAAWFDEQAGIGLTWLASLFTGGGGKGGHTPVYTAITKLLDLDVTGAIDAILPGVGTKLAETFGGWASDIGGSFPRIQEALGTLFTSVANWVLTEGIPSLSRAAGHIGGSLAAALYDAINTAFSIITDPATYSTAGSIASVVAKYVDTSIVPEVLAGWDEGIAGSTLATEGIPSITSFFAQLIAGVEQWADKMEIDKLVAAFDPLITGLIDFVGDLAEADWSGVTKLIEIAVGLSAGIATLANSAAASLLEAMGAGLQILGDGIKAFINGLAGVMSLDPELVLTSIGDGIRYLVGALVLIPLTIIDTVTSLIQTIADFAGLDVSFPDLTQQLVDWVNETERMIEQEAVIRSSVRWEPDTGYVIDMTGVTDREAFIAGLDSFSPAMSAALAEALKTIPLEVPLGRFVAQLTDETQIELPQVGDITTALMEGRTPAEALSLEAPLDAVTYQIMPYTEAALVQFGGGDMLPTVPVATASARVGQFQLDIGGADVTTDQQLDVAGAVLPDGTLGTHVTEETTAAMEMMSAVLLGSFAAGGVTDPQIVTDNFLLPLTSAFQTHLGPDSETVASVVSFAGSVETELVRAGQSMVALSVLGPLAMGSLTLGLAIAKPAILGILGEVRAAVDSLAAAFGSLAATAGQAMQAATQAWVLDGLAGSRAAGGPVASGSTYLVGEKGPELFTARSSGSIIPTDVLVGGARRGASSGGPSQQTIIINEASNLDSIIYEAKRRGIIL